MRIIEEFPDYLIEESGVIINKKSLSLIKQRLDKNGYSVVNLYKNKKMYTRKIHRLVAIAYIGLEGTQLTVNHIDGVKSNNHYSNLEFLSSSDNTKHAYRNGLKDNTGEANPSSKLTENKVRVLRKLFGIVSMKDLAALVDVSYKYLYQIKDKSSWRDL